MITDQTECLFAGLGSILFFMKLIWYIMLSITCYTTLNKTYSSNSTRPLASLADQTKFYQYNNSVVKIKAFKNGALIDPTSRASPNIHVSLKYNLINKIKCWTTCSAISWKYNFILTYPQHCGVHKDHLKCVCPYNLNLNVFKRLNASYKCKFNCLQLTAFIPPYK